MRLNAIDLPFLDKRPSPPSAVGCYRANGHFEIPSKTVSRVRKAEPQENSFDRPHDEKEPCGGDTPTPLPQRAYPRDRWTAAVRVGYLEKKGPVCSPHAAHGGQNSRGGHLTTQERCAAFIRESFRTNRQAGALRRRWTYVGRSQRCPPGGPPRGSRTCGERERRFAEQSPERVSHHEA